MDIGQAASIFLLFLVVITATFLWIRIAGEGLDHNDEEVIAEARKRKGKV